jgi:hypothetical protein
MSFRHKCRHCGVRVPRGISCSYCGGPQPATLARAAAPLTWLSMAAVFFMAGASLLGGSAEAFLPKSGGSELPSEEEVAGERDEVPWVFAKEMSAAVGRDVDDSSRREPPIGYEE